MQIWKCVLCLYKTVTGVCIIIYKQSATRDVVCPSNDVWKAIHSHVYCLYLQKKPCITICIKVYKYSM